MTNPLKKIAVGKRTLWEKMIEAAGSARKNIELYEPETHGIILHAYESIKQPVGNAPNLASHLKVTIDLSIIRLHGFNSFESCAAFINRIPRDGNFSNRLRGDLLENLAFHFVPLHADCMTIGNRYISRLNNAGPESLFGAGPSTAPVVRRGKFGAIARVTNVKMKSGGETKMFTDVMYVAHTGETRPQWTVAVGLEVKAPASAAEFIEQGDGFLVRLGDRKVDRISFDYEGTNITVNAEDLVFYVEEVNQVAATVFNTRRFGTQIKQLGKAYKLDNPFKYSLDPAKIYEESRFRIIGGDNSAVYRADLLIDVGLTNTLVSQAILFYSR